MTTKKTSLDLGYCGMDDEGYFDAVMRMFEQALKYVIALPETKRQSFIERLERVCLEGHDVGWGVGDDYEQTAV